MLTTILEEIERGLEVDVSYLALAVSVSIPDICAALESKNGWATRDKYLDWCNRYLQEAIPPLTPDDLYSMRNGVLHQGHFGDQKTPYVRIFFTDAQSAGHFVGSRFSTPDGPVLAMDIPSLCRGIVTSARKWESENFDNELVQSNLVRLLRRRPNGLDPYIVGTSVIA